MKFIRPVSSLFRITRQYGEYGKNFFSFINPETGLWTDGQICEICRKICPCKCNKPSYVGQHRGVDFACPEGTPVVSMAGGMIVRTGMDILETPHHVGHRVVQIVSQIGFDSWWITYRNLGEICEFPSGRMISAGDRLGYTSYDGTGSPFLHVELKDLKGQWRPLPLDPEICRGGCKT